jgi:shikimate dehydrogenase
MKKLGLIGYPVGHSFSKIFFSEKFTKENLPDWAYELYPLEKIERLKSFLSEEPDLVGFNVTVPYKVSVVNYLDEIDPLALLIGSVNTVCIIDEGKGRKLKGYNTDAYGFEKSFSKLIAPGENRALVLGTGGSSRAVKYVLRESGIPYTSVSRKSHDNRICYEDVTESTLKSHNIIINTTPVGMFPNVDAAPPLPYEFINKTHLLFDLIYNPEETLFLKLGREQGARTKNGLEMLRLQSDKCWEIWNEPVTVGGY